LNVRITDGYAFAIALSPDRALRVRVALSVRSLYNLQLVTVVEHGPVSEYSFTSLKFLLSPTVSLRRGELTNDPVAFKSVVLFLRMKIK
jgi:hypothetical protein